MFKANIIALINSRIQNPEFGIDYVLKEIKGIEFKVNSAAAEFEFENQETKINREFLYK
jgi:hypothetical protein